MKNILVLTAILAFSFLLSCNSQKTNSDYSHDSSEPHSHEAESASNSNDYFGAYDLEDKTYGTKTKVTITNKARVMVTNALPNHKTGKFPRKGNPNTISAQNKTYNFPLNPKYTGKAKWVREPGVALNGVKFEPGTAEVVECETGENYRVEAFQDVINLGLDFNNAHVQPTGAYHYHGAPTAVVENFDTGEDLVHIGFAHDGFPIYYSKIEKYKSSYKALVGNREGEDCVYENPKQTINIAVGGHHDGTFTSDFEYVENYGDLDECNGITINGNYLYLVTNTFPYVSRCLMGEVEQRRSRGQANSRGRQRKGRPSFKELLEMMDTNNDMKISKSEAKGPLSENFSRIDANNDNYLSKDEIEKIGRQGRGQRPQGRRSNNRRN